MVLKKSLMSVSVLIAVVIIANPVYAGKMSKRYQVISNWHYINTYNVHSSHGSKRDAVNCINSMSYKARGGYYVLDKATKEVVWPNLNSKQSRIDKTVAWVKATIKNRSHGYTCEGELRAANLNLTSPRWGLRGDYSCSTIVSMAYELSGFVQLRSYAREKKAYFIRKGKKIFGINSSNMASLMIQSGAFKEITSSYKNNGLSALKAGDVLFNHNRSHVAIYLGNGNIGEAVMNEKNAEYAISCKPGNQTGSELRIVGLKNGRFAFAYRPIV